MPLKYETERALRYFEHSEENYRISEFDSVLQSCWISYKGIILTCGNDSKKREKKKKEKGKTRAAKEDRLIVVHKAIKLAKIITS